VPEIKKLHDNLKRQALLYHELKDYAQRKQKALVENDLHSIEAITVREEQLIMEASNLEKERLLWAEQIAKSLGKVPEDITLSELAERFPELNDVKADLEEVLTNLREINDLNTQLIKQAIKVVELSIDLISAPVQSNVYNRPGEKEAEHSPLRFIDKSV